MTISTRDIIYKEADEQLFENKLKMLEIANKLKFKFKNGKKLYDAEKVRYIVDNYGIIPDTEIAKNVKMNIFTVRQILKDYGKTIKYIGENSITFCTLYKILFNGTSNDYIINLFKKFGCPVSEGFPVTVDLFEFFAWAGNHKQLLFCPKYKEGSLPVQPEWFLKKVEYDKRAFCYTYRRPWSESDDKILKNMVEYGCGFNEISIKLKRTGNAIKRRCYDLKIEHPKRNKRRLWTVNELETVKTMWLAGALPCVIAEEIDRNHREIQGTLERYKYFGQKPLKYACENAR